MQSKDQVQGEGDYESARHYNQAAREYVRSHDVEEGARAAAPKSASEHREMEEAEQIGKAQARPDPESEPMVGADVEGDVDDLDDVVDAIDADADNVADGADDAEEERRDAATDRGLASDRARRRP